MNRRSFLTSAGAATAALAVPTALTAQYITKNPNPPPQPPHTPPHRYPPDPVNIPAFHAAGAVHNLAIASLFRGNATAQDYQNAASALAVVHSNWLGADLDTRLIPGFNNVNEQDLTTSKMPMAWFTNNIRSFNPAVTQPQVTSYLNNMLANSVVNGVDYKTTVLQKCRAGGTSSLIAGGINAFNAMATQLQLHPPKIDPATHRYVPQIKIDVPPPRGYTGGCAFLSLGGLALGIASVVLTVMTGWGVLAVAGWEAVAFWAGSSSVGFGVELDFMC